VWEALIGNLGVLTENATATVQVTLLGILCAVLIGTPTGYLMAHSKVFERLLSPFIVALQAVPTVIIAPLLVLWLGYGLGAKLVVTTLVSIFPLIISTMVGVREVDRVYREAFRTMGAGAWQTFVRLELPGALPSLLSGLRLSVTLALIGTVVGEFVFGGPGLGYLANSERLNFRTDNAVAAVSVTVLIGLLLYGTVGLLEKRGTKHHAP
jgi:NitT/TauT family transport system ATP-binding protein